MFIELINDQPEHSGAGVYSWNLYRQLKEIPGLVFCHYNHPQGSCDFYGREGKERTIPVGRYRAKPIFWHLCSQAYQHQDNVHLLSQNLSFLMPGKRRIVTCLDLIPLIMPSNPLEKVWRRVLYAGLRKADHIISISQATKNDLARMYKIPPAKITPIRLGVSPEYHPLDKRECRKKLGLPEDGRIVLHVGTPAPRKNFSTVIEAFALAAKVIGGAVLVKVGALSPKDKLLAERKGLGTRLIIRDSVRAEDLPLFYAGADVFVFPSLYEGFGLPVLEAMASGCPVITSNTTSLPEVAGDAGIMIDPTDQESLKNKIMELLENGKLSGELTQKGLLRAKTFNWKSTAENTLAVYKKVFG